MRETTRRTAMAEETNYRQWGEGQKKTKNKQDIGLKKGWKIVQDKKKYSRHYNSLKPQERWPPPTRSWQTALHMLGVWQSLNQTNLRHLHLHYIGRYFCRCRGWLLACNLIERTFGKVFARWRDFLKCKLTGSRVSPGGGDRQKLKCFKLIKRSLLAFVSL